MTLHCPSVVTIFSSREMGSIYTSTLFPKPAVELFVTSVFRWAALRARAPRFFLLVLLLPYCVSVPAMSGRDNVSTIGIVCPPGVELRHGTARASKRRVDVSNFFAAPWRSRFGGEVRLNAGATPAARAPAEAKVGEEFSLQPGGSAQIIGEALSLRFERVVSDSRCPVGVTCVWEGDAVARIQLEGTSGQTMAADLHTSPSFSAEVTFQGYRVRLVRLAPPRQEDAQISPESYVATLIVLRS